MLRFILPALAAIAIVVAAPALADPPGDRHQRGEARDSDLGRVIISAAERALIGDYYRSHGMATDQLPPGIRKKVARGKPLPPGIAKRFPDGLRGQLPARPGYDYRVIGSDVALIDLATGVMVDVVKDILR